METAHDVKVTVAQGYDLFGVMKQRRELGAAGKYECSGYKRLYMVMESIDDAADVRFTAKLADGSGIPPPDFADYSGLGVENTNVTIGFDINGKYSGQVSVNYQDIWNILSDNAMAYDDNKDNEEAQRLAK